MRATTPRPGGADQSHLDVAREALIEAALPHVPFDGWSGEALRRALVATGQDGATAELLFPRGGVDMALAFHDLMDQRLAAELAETDLSRMRISDRVSHAVRRRIELVEDHREAVRRGATLFGLPLYAAEGAQAIWRTADIIWNACGDTAVDYNWYTKRAILSSVYSATVLYWLGDESGGHASTWAFLDRRIGDVMQFEKTKAMLAKNPFARTAFWGPMQVLKLVRAPTHARGRRA